MIPETYNDVIALNKCCSIEKNYEIDEDSILKDMYDILRNDQDNYIEGNRTKLCILNKDNQIIKTYMVNTKDEKLNTIKITTKKTTKKRYI